MNKVLVCLVCIIINVMPAKVRASLFDPSTIPNELLANANVVIRSSQVSYILKSESKALIRVHKVITVLSGKGNSSARITLYYDESSKITSFRGNLYDGSGTLFRHVEKQDLTDYSAVPDGILYSDDRCKVFSPAQNTYPYTFEYEYETEVSDFFGLDTWYPQDEYNQSVESSSFSLSYAEGLHPRYKQVNLADPPLTYKDKGATVLEWSVKSLAARDEEPYSPSFSDHAPAIYTAPSEFSIAGFKGSITTWKDVGEFFYQLDKSREDLPPATVALVRQMVDTIPDVTAKVSALYSYMQSKTRYVGVLIGIGGFQPEPASKVDLKGYGDCKALANYMKCLLGAAGIQSYVALVRAGENHPDIVEDFPCSQFNHAILCVPLAKDTVWLECTSQKCPFGFLGEFTDDRPVLLITPEGGIMARTPGYTRNENESTRLMEITLDSAGNAVALITSVFRGLKYSLVEQMPDLPFSEQKKSLEGDLKVSGCKVLTARYTLDKSPVPVAVEKIHVSLPALAVVSGDRIFLPVSLPGFLPGHPKNDEKRKSEVVILRESLRHDSIVIRLPGGYKVESLPGPQTFSSPFGSYRSMITSSDSGITITRTVEGNEGTYSPEQFNELVDYFRQISKSMKEKAILVRNK